MKTWENKDFKDFYTYYLKIWYKFIKYGENVLKIDLERDEETIKKVFWASNSKEDFFKNMLQYWADNYKNIVNSCKDIQKVYLEYKNKKIYVYPNGEASHLGVQISKDFLEKIQEHKCEEEDITYICVDGFLYQISFGKDVFDYIIINNRTLIKDILKDN